MWSACSVIELSDDTWSENVIPPKLVPEHLPDFDIDLQTALLWLYTCMHAWQPQSKIEVG